MSHSALDRTARFANAKFTHCILFLAAGMLSLGCVGPEAGPPVAEKKAVTDVYHGVSVTEDYRWLENFDNTDVQAWSDSQSAFTRSYLDGIPERESIYGQLKDLYAEGYVAYFGLRYQNGVFFALKSQPPSEQPYLVRLSSLYDTGSEQIILDVNKLDSNFTTAIDFFVPSRGAQWLAVSLSHKGSEKGTVYVYDASNCQRTTDSVPGVNGPTAGGSVAWNADGSGFYYTRYPRAGERPDKDLSFYQQIYYHKIGTPTQEDTYEIGSEFPRIAEVDLLASDVGDYTLATVSNGDGGDHVHYLRDGTRKQWTQITQYSDDVDKVQFGPEGSLFLYSHKDSPRGRILRIPVKKPSLTEAVVVVPESEVAISDFLPTESRVYVVDVLGGPSRVRAFDMQGQALEPPDVPPISAVRSPIAVGGDKVLFNLTSYVEPSAWIEYDPATTAFNKTALFVVSKADFSGVEVVREFATSKDGTEIPMNIIRPKGVRLDGQNPTVLTGYGGYGSSLTPGFDADRSVWLGQGGIYVIANLRGGGEFGEEWHRAGNLTNKQNVFDDFAACAEHLIKSGYTNPSKLAIEGGSNGGLLMGAAFTQHPELFAAVVSHVGLYDMLRVELDPNGEFNVTEFGTVNDPDQFRALYAYSPYHHITDGVPYPALLFLTGQHDGRVNPAHSRKMTARLQAATGSDRPILLRTSSSTGHGQGTALSRRIERNADVYAFLFHELDIGYKDRALTRAK
jgi:prolyl oligopeptidase